MSGEIGVPLATLIKDFYILGYFFGGEKIPALASCRNSSNMARRFLNCPLTITQTGIRVDLVSWFAT
jgi:hypothetical protein